MSRGTALGLIALMTIAIAPTTSAQNVRVFMAADGAQGTAPTTGNTSIYIAPGETVSVSVWIEDPDELQELYAGQVILRWEAMPQTGATGLVDYVNVPFFSCVSFNPTSPYQPCIPGNSASCGGVPTDCIPSSGGSVFASAGRSDFVFAGEAFDGPIYHESPPPQPPTPLSGTGFGMVVPLSSVLDSVVVTGIRYLFEFQIAASPNAFGQHELRFVPINQAPAGGSFFIRPGGLTEYFINEYQQLTIVITECGDGLIQGTEECDDGNTDAGDGCTATCVVEPGFTCDGEPSTCDILAAPFMTPGSMLVLTMLLLTGVTIVARKQAGQLAG